MGVRVGVLRALRGRIGCLCCCLGGRHGSRCNWFEWKSALRSSFFPSCSSPPDAIRRASPFPQRIVHTTSSMSTSSSARETACDRALARPLSSRYLSAVLVARASSLRFLTLLFGCTSQLRIPRAPWGVSALGALLGRRCQTCTSGIVSLPLQQRSSRTSVNGQQCSSDVSRGATT